jgi:hypothetical protein
MNSTKDVIMDPTKEGTQPPAFICIGVQKSGTTTLHYLLAKHPEILMSSQKELQFFTFNYHLGINWYLSQWPMIERTKLRGETTPYYIFHPYAAERMKQCFPKIKILILLRDPVERTISQYYHSVRIGVEDLDIADALKQEDERIFGANQYLLNPAMRHKSHQEHSYISRSRYEQQIPRWLDHFGKEQCLILSSDKFFSHPEEIWHTILNFLQITIIPLPVATLARLNAGDRDSKQVSERVRNEIAAKLAPTYEYMRQLPI